MVKVKKQGAHFKKENRSNPDYIIAGKTAYNKKYIPKKPDIRCRRRGEFT